MPAPVERFYTPEHDFGELHRISDKIERNRYREEQRAEREAVRNAATGKFLADYLDPKSFLTGTYYDPQIVKGFNDLLVEGSALAKKGADANMLMMALGPKVNQLSQYSTKAKLLNERLKTQLSHIKPNMGYDVPKLEQEARRAAFFDPTGKLKDINTVDPEMDWVSEVIKISPEKVTTDVGIDEFVKNSPKFVNTKDVTTYTPRGGMERKKVKITSPNWLVPDNDEKGAMTGLVPRYQTAMDGGSPVMHEFTDDQGNKKTAPVRILDEGDFKSILSSNPGIADWVRGQVRLANPDIDLNSPQATIAARAILYNELKRRKPGGIEDVEVTKPNPIKVYAPSSASSDKAAAKAAANDWLKNTITAVKEKDNTKITDQFNILERGGRFVDFNIEQEGDEVVVSYKTPLTTDAVTGEERGNKIITRRFKDDHTLGDKLKGVYQTATGEDKVFEYSTIPKVDATPKPQKKMVTVVLADGREGQIPEDQVANFLKDNKGSKRK